MATISEASAVCFRQNLGDMLNQVQYRHDSIVIKRDGKPMAALVEPRSLWHQGRRLLVRRCSRPVVLPKRSIRQPGDQRLYDAVI
ncbi:MAG: hypothetical protein VKI83_03390 [Synechococcaceae cyanobacterium]|nr:hypothetical protein [Synechococcaceae cyanobacterium]